MPEATNMWIVFALLFGVMLAADPGLNRFWSLVRGVAL